MKTQIPFHPSYIPPMNPHHHTFINAMLDGDSKEQAYAKAYPKAKESARTSAANRLLNRPAIKAALDERNAAINAMVDKRVAARRLQQALQLEEAKELLQSIVRGQHTTWRQVKVKGGFEKVEVYPSHAQILRALNMFLKLADLWPETKRQNEQQKTTTRQAEEATEDVWLTIGDKPFDPVEGTKYAQWYPLYYASTLWNPTKPAERPRWQQYMNTLSEEERAPFIENVRKWDEEQQQKTTTYNNQGESFPHQGRHSERATASVESGEPMQIGTSELRIAHTAASHQISPHALRNDELDGTYENDKNHNILQQKTTAHSQPPTANCEKDYISLSQALAISKAEKKRHSQAQVNWLTIMMSCAKHNKKPRPNQRAMMKETGWELHPTDSTKVRPCACTMNFGSPTPLPGKRAAPKWPPPGWGW